MTKISIFLYTILLGILILIGCGDADDGEARADGDLSTEIGNWNAGDAETANAIDNGYKEGESAETDPAYPSGSYEEDDFEVCETVTANLEQVATRVMILLDRSESMDDDNKWELALSAIDSMVTEFDERIAFGLDVFSASAGSDRWSRRDTTMCDVGDSAVLDVESNNGNEILGALNTFSPGQATPLLLAMTNYSDPQYSPQFMASKGDSYLVIISDGMDTCGSDGSFDRGGGASAEQLSEMAAQINRESKVKTIVIGFGEGADPEQLDAIAQSGGAQFTEHFDAGDGDELTAALDSIAEAVVVSCQFEIGQIDESELNLDLVNVFFDDTAIPRDIDCERNAGWTWTGSDRRTIKFCQAACDQIKANDANDFRLEIACSADDVLVI